MSDQLTYWKCPKCHGTGFQICGGREITCYPCDGTGNAMVDGAARAHRRALSELRNRRLQEASHD